MVTGFLGAGKTSFIKLYARWLEKNGVRYAIIENEFGMSGIDSSILRNSCGDVTELSGGCICCGLKVNFYSLLQELAGNGNYDRIIVEPSGIFNLDDFLDVINSLSEKNILELGTIITVAEPEYISPMI